MARRHAASASPWRCSSFSALARLLWASKYSGASSVALRYEAIASASHGFVYCVAAYGVTGGRDELPVTARQVVAAVRPHTDLPLLVGVGIATPEQAGEASTFADGIIVGSALMAPLVAGDPAGALQLAEAFRRQIG